MAGQYAKNGIVLYLEIEKKQRIKSISSKIKKQTFN